jgi:hypothetical protein
MKSLQIKHVRNWLATVTFLTIAAALSGCDKRGASDAPGGEAVDAEVLVPLAEGKGLHDFGYILPKSRHVVSFAVENPTDRALPIKRVRNECECQRPMDFPKEIAPGGWTRFLVEFIAPDENMHYSKWIALMTGETGRGMIILHIKADVGLPLAVEPKVVKLGSLSPGREHIASVTIRNSSDKPVRPLYAMSTRSECVAQISRAEIPPKGSLSIPLLVRVDTDDSGQRKATVTIHTDCPAQPRVAVQVTYTVASTSAPKAAKRTASASLSAAR